MGFNSWNTTEVEPQKDWLDIPYILEVLTLKGKCYAKAPSRISVPHPLLANVGIQESLFLMPLYVRLFKATTTGKSAQERGFFSVKVTSSYFYLLMLTMFIMCFFCNPNFCPVAALTN